MSKPLKLYIQSLRSTKKKRRQLACVVTALSVLVSGNVFWQLRGIGTAMVDMNLPSADDSGGDITAVPLVSSELETPDVWEATLPPLTDIAGDNLARIAESQLGYTESSVNFVHSEDGETHSGYTRYGAWYGNPYGDWNTMFTYFCMDYAGVSPDDIPCGSGCWAWSLELEKAELITPLSDGSPHRGDILLMDYDADGKADRSCIVSSADDDVLTVIEGDVDGSVAECTYLPTDERFIGMVSLEGLTAEPPVLPAGLAQLDFSAESESGIRVEAHADWGAFPYDTVMSVSDISRDEAIQTAADQLGEDAENIDAVAVDITFTAPDGSELEPAEGAQVSVSIALPDEQALSDGEFSLLHVTDDGDVHEVAEADVSADGAEFTAESFSMYIVTASGINIVDGIVMEDGNTGNNSETNPYILYLNERLTVLYKGEYKDDGRITVFDNSDDNIKRYSYGPSNSDYNESTYRRAEFYGNSVGTCRVSMLKTTEWSVSNIAESFYVKVVDPSVTNKPSHDIYLNTALGERHIDNLHEVLERLNDGAASDWYVYDALGNPQYIKNLDQDCGGSFYGAYRINPGDVIEVVAYCKESEKNSLDFAVGEKGSHKEAGLIEKVGESTKVKVTSGEHIGEYRISAKFKALKTGSTKRTGISFGSDFFYLIVTSNETLSHADIEIADGGTYRVESTVTDVDGTVTKTITEYDAWVNNVNHCYLKDTNGNFVQTFLTAHYYRRGEPGSSQYELTSNYIPRTDGGTDLRLDKPFILDDVQSAEFDVQILLKPKTITTIVNNETQSVEDISSQESQIIPSTVFNLGRQAVIDAYNKCPARTGLDFTIKSALNQEIKSVPAQVEANKTITHGFKPDEGKYNFELYTYEDSYEYCAKKIADGGFKAPGVVFSVNEVFSDYETGDVVTAFMLVDHSDWEHYAAGFDGVNFQKYYGSMSSSGMMGHIDNINGGQFPEQSVKTFYKAVADYTIPGHEISPSGTNFTLSTAGHYFFIKKRTEKKTVATATNDADGNIVFTPQVFMKEGTYTYYIKEKAEYETNPDVKVYDDTVHTVTITVTKQTDGSLTSSVTYDGGTDPPTFNNTLYEYTLPSTGGTGDLPYIIFGSAMISGALLLLYRRRKKEVAQ